MVYHLVVEPVMGGIVRSLRVRDGGLETLDLLEEGVDGEVNRHRSPSFTRWMRVGRRHDRALSEVRGG